MANEIQTTLRLQITNGGYSDSFNESPTITQSTLGSAGGIQSIGTTAEALAVGDVATLGYLAVKNLDATNFVTWGPDDAGTMKTCGRLKPGESAVLRLEPGITLKVKADTATCKIKYLLLNN